MKCTVTGCSEDTAIYITEVKQYSLAKEEYMCDKHAQEYYSFLSSWGKNEGNLLSQKPGSTSPRFELRYVALFHKDSSSLLFLSEVDGVRKIAIPSGYYEAMAIRVAVRRDPMPRPWTFPAVAMIIEALGGTLQDVNVDEFDEQGHYHAKIRIQQKNHEISVDLRPSDALPLAIVCKVPIFFSEAALSKVLADHTHRS